MIKVNLQNTAVQNMLTGQNTLDSVFIDGNSILFIEKPEYLKQLYRDEIKARAIKINLKVAREEIHKRTQDDRYNNLDDMETLKKFRAQTDELRETEKEYRRMLGECENVKMIPVYSGTKLDVTTGDSVEVKQAEFKIILKQRATRREWYWISWRWMLTDLREIVSGFRQRDAASTS